MTAVVTPASCQAASTLTARLLFCRHNRFAADCPICAKDGLPPAPARSGRAPRRPGGAKGPAKAAGGGAFRGPYAAAGPYERADGSRYEVRLERVPGGLRLAEWAGGALQRRAPLLSAADLRRLVGEAGERDVLRPRDVERFEGALASAPGDDAPSGNGAAASGGRAGDLREELRVEPVGDDRMLRVARWVLRPGSGWQLLDAPPMYPPERYAEALGAAARLGLV